MGILKVLAMGNRSSPWNDTLRPVSRCTALAPTTPPAIFETRSISRSSRGSCGSAASSALVRNSAARANRRAAVAKLVIASRPSSCAIHHGPRDKPGRRRGIGEIPACEISEAKNFFHFSEVDFLHRVGRLMIVGMKARKPPDRGNIAQGEGELVAALEDVQRGVPIPFVVDPQPHVLVGALHRGAVVRSIDCADEVQLV